MSREGREQVEKIHTEVRDIGDKAGLKMYHDKEKRVLGLNFLKDYVKKLRASNNIFILFCFLLVTSGFRQNDIFNIRVLDTKPPFLHFSNLSKNHDKEFVFQREIILTSCDEWLDVRRYVLEQIPEDQRLCRG